MKAPRRHMEAAMQHECPKCGTGVELCLKESLDPYKVRFDITPEDGRMISAETAGKALMHFAKIVSEMGDALGHKTQVVMHSAEVNDAMVVKFTVVAIPVGMKK